MKLSVVLSGKSYFKGFLLEARDAADWGSVTPIGTFTLTSAANTQLLTCNKHQVDIPIQSQTNVAVFICRNRDMT